MDATAEYYRLFYLMSASGRVFHYKQKPRQPVLLKLTFLQRYYELKEKIYFIS